MIISKVISSVIEKANRVIKVLAFGRQDSRSAKQVTPFGIDSVPVKDMLAVYASTQNDSERVVIGYLPLAELRAAVGEIRLFATDNDGVEQNRLWLYKNGKIDIGGTGASNNPNHLVRWEDLDTSLQNMLTQINTAVTVFNAHTHPYVNVAVPATTSPTATPMTPPTLNISSAKTTKLLIE